MRTIILLALLFLHGVGFSQQINSGAASSKGKCSPPVTGEHNTVTIHCDTIQSSREMARLLQVVHDSEASTQEILNKLNIVLEEMSASTQQRRLIHSFRIVVSFDLPGYRPDLNERFTTMELEEGLGGRWQRLSCESLHIPLMLVEHRVFPSGKPNERNVHHTHELYFEPSGAVTVVGEDVGLLGACQLSLSAFTLIRGSFNKNADDLDQLGKMHASIIINEKTLPFPDAEFTFLKRLKVNPDAPPYVSWTSSGDIGQAYFQP